MLPKGIKDSDILLANINPRLIQGEFVFSTVHGSFLAELKFVPLMIFVESEGVSLIIDKKIADEHSILYNEVWKMITLNVHSDLTAIGFLAKITSKLEEAGISVNVVSAFYHDHLFVEVKNAEKAMMILKLI